ncbi:unnamed protein product [Haemonchus placei]|uniref:Kinesin motor domain-containing protein n=1 Tax=Haemonchus placei TaxID=6290 RepID=A0A0N4WQA5_HAEPC|nr:unnamed protein product [Haemonchus placei]
MSSTSVDICVHRVDEECHDNDDEDSPPPVSLDEIERAESVNNQPLILTEPAASLIGQTHQDHYNPERNVFLILTPNNVDKVEGIRDFTTVENRSICTYSMVGIR